MSNITITNRNLEGIVVYDPVFDNRTLTATGAEVWPAGAVLARVTASGKYVRFDPAGSGGAEVPLAILTQEVEFTAAGDRTERPAIAGQFRTRDLVDADGTAITAAAIETLRQVSIICFDTRQLSEQDNQ